jgi:hypothetical protein
VGATEPIAPTERRTTLAQEFSSSALVQGKSVILMPVSFEFSNQCRAAGFHSIQVGSEAVFDLKEYFSRHKDPLFRFPHARSLARKGLKVTELDLQNLSIEFESQIEKLTDSWQSNKKSRPLEFLNQVNPFHLREYKKLFALLSGETVIGFICATPIPAKNSYFFADYVRSPDSRAGSMELLFIESMRILESQGFKEVRLGLCIFSRLNYSNDPTLREKTLFKLMRWAFQYVKYPVQFQSLYEFKNKFAPSRWESLYLVSNKKIGLITALNVLRVHLGAHPVQDWLRLQGRALLGFIRPEFKIQALPNSLFQWARSCRISLVLFSAMMILHFLRLTQNGVASIFSRSAFSPSHPDAAGIFLGPLFHNNYYHLLGDLSSLLFFGALVELILGRTLLSLIVGLGLWVSNPITLLTLHLFLPVSQAQSWNTFLSEQDYGSSNAVYALAGALGAVVKQPLPIVLPFILNGLFLCLARDSWLSLHHLIGLAIGYFCVRIYSWFHLTQIENRVTPG